MSELIANYSGKEAVLTFLQALSNTYENERFQIVKEAKREGFNESRCTDNGNRVTCTHNEARLNTGIWLRSVLWEVPLGEAPADGWPVVLHFQGSFFAPHLFSWDASQLLPFGAYEQTLGIKMLLDSGYAVITPETHMTGFIFWDTNIPPFSIL